MINPPVLPLLTEQYLSHIVKIQLALLDYAACLPKEQGIDKDGLIVHLAQGELSKQSSAIGNWLYNGSTRVKVLNEFATSGSTTEKQNLLQTIKQDIAKFNIGVGQLTRIGDSEVASAQKVKFFYIYFYEDALPESFDASLFPFPNAISFSMGKLLLEYKKFNKYLCAVCESGDAVSYSIKDGRYKGSVDHYFPKALYPFLACHPLNLVPICTTCNSSYKGSKDPQRNSRFRLEDIYLPYRADTINEALGSQTYLEVIRQKTHFFLYNSIKPRPNQLIQTKIEILDYLYQIPGRWNAAPQLEEDSISESLFRRIEQYMLHWDVIALESNLHNFLYLYLHEFITQQGKERYSYALVWLLATLIKEEVTANSAKSGKTAFSKELQKCLSTVSSLSMDTKDSSEVLDNYLQVRRRGFDKLDFRYIEQGEQLCILLS